MDAEQKRIVEMAEQHFQLEFSKWLVENPMWSEKPGAVDLAHSWLKKFYLLGLQGRAAVELVKDLEKYDTKSA